MILGVAIHDLLAWILAVFFLVGGIGNWLAPASVREEYARWGYPDWFHRVTAILELAGAILLVFAVTRLLGIVVVGVVMVAAIATLLRHGEYRHALLPIAVLIVVLVMGWLSF